MNTLASTYTPDTPQAVVAAVRDQLNRTLAVNFGSLTTEAVTYNQLLQFARGQVQRLPRTKTLVQFVQAIAQRLGASDRTTRQVCDLIFP